MEESHGVGPATHASHQEIRQPPFHGQALIPRFLANHGLEVPYEHGVRMRTGDAADDVVGVVDVRDPVPHRLVHGVLQGARTGGHGGHLGA